MAKAKDKKAAKGSPAAKAEAAASYKFGVEDVAKATGRQPTSVRVAFRKNNVEKAEGGVYGWNSKDEMQKAIDKAFPATKKSAEKAPTAKKASKKK